MTPQSTPDSSSDATPDATPAAPSEPKSRRFGTGWFSGVLSATLGVIGFGAVLCFHYPHLLTMPELRGKYPLPEIRALLHLVLLASFLFGALSVVLRRWTYLGAAGITLTLLAAALGGSRVVIDDEFKEGPFLGLDWFLLNLIAYSLVFIPLERLFPHRPAQLVFRPGWRTDLAYFFVSSLLVQLTTLLTMRPAMTWFAWARFATLTEFVGSQPAWLQFVEILVVTDVVQYWIHRQFHEIPWLWRFHEVHHSAENMDWLAGSRLHLVDVAVTRGLTYVPIYVLGFDEGPLFAYVVLVSLQATFIHANVRFEFGPLRWLLATPQFHHWHHAADAEGIDKNFAVHLPLIDYVFGTFHLPTGRWPARYGLADQRRLPGGYLRQFVLAFLPRKSDSANAERAAAKASSSPAVSADADARSDEHQGSHKA